jgi:hypothetical protein
MSEPTMLEWADRMYWVAKPYADRGETITYGQVARAVGYVEPLHHTKFGSILALLFIADKPVCESIVRKDTRKPGMGFFLMQQAMDSYGKTEGVAS